MNYEIIGSSSKGNCIIVEKKIMLDCGVSYRNIKNKLNELKLIFISHGHQDHLLPTTIKKISYNFPTIKFLTGSEVVVEKLVECGVNKKNIFILKSNKWYDLGLLKVKLEPLTHDTPNYALKWKYKEKKGIYCVDTSRIDHIEAKNYDLFLIENNYREDILKKHIDECEDENMMYYLSRVERTHLSDEQTNSFLIENMGDNSVYEYIHQSDYNYERRD